MFIITLTAIPSRFGHLRHVLTPLLEQNRPADRVILYIPKSYRRFPDWDGALPAVPEGVEIRRCEQDFGPATKVLPAVREFSGEDLDILFCDDDRHYEPDWTEPFLKARETHPRAAIASSFLNLPNFGLPPRAAPPGPRARRLPRLLDLKYRARRLAPLLRGDGYAQDRKDKPSRREVWRSGHGDTFQGYGGVLVRPEFFPQAAFDIPKEGWAVDDIWLSGLLAANGIPIWVVKDATRQRTTEMQREAALHLATIDGANRAEANKRCALFLQREFGVWCD